MFVPSFRAAKKPRDLVERPLRGRESDALQRPAGGGLDATFDPLGFCAAAATAHNPYVSVLEVFVPRVRADGRRRKQRKYGRGRR